MNARVPLPELESLPKIRWIYPIIGNSIRSTISDVKQLKCRAHDVLETKMDFCLVGETEAFEINEYTSEIRWPTAHEYLQTCLNLQAVEIRRVESAVYLNFYVQFNPKRPVAQSALLQIKNPLKQEWQFKLDFVVDIGRPCDSITIESLLNKTGIARPVIPASFRAPTPFHAYFTTGSSAEFSLSVEHGILDSGTRVTTDVPVDVIFAPKMYGKAYRGLLVVDTIETQYLFDIVGKTPEYVPPVVTKSRDIPPVAEQRPKTKKRNIIQDNIENVRILRPMRAKTSLGSPTAKSVKL
jgi:hypothetical protein